MIAASSYAGENLVPSNLSDIPGHQAKKLVKKDLMTLHSVLSLLLELLSLIAKDRFVALMQVVLI
jgi:hypothetical protein